MALAGAVVGLAGVTYVTSYTLLLVAAFALGFFLDGEKRVDGQRVNDIAGNDRKINAHLGRQITNHGRNPRRRTGRGGRLGR